MRGMRTLKTPVTMQRAAVEWRKAGRRISFVPTMGFLHQGHESLIRAARRRVGPEGVVVVSIYVNPTQFGANEDLARYPRDLPRDLQKCRAAGVDAVFVPSDAVMYPGAGREAYSTYVVEERLSSVMEGVSRPTHFRGVTTIVTKLFNCVLPDIAMFGAKDWQQAAVVKRMTADLNFPVRIEVVPTLREKDGLALSSRNVRLTAIQRSQATVLWEALNACRRAVAQGPVAASRLRRSVERRVGSRSEARLDYVEFFDGTTLQSVKRVAPGSHMALAVRFGDTRLIDNGVL